MTARALDRFMFMPSDYVHFANSACIVCDEDATSELRVKTVRYFKGIQETNDTLLVRSGACRLRSRLLLRLIFPRLRHNNHIVRHSYNSCAAEAHGGILWQVPPCSM